MDPAGQGEIAAFKSVADHRLLVAQKAGKDDCRAWSCQFCDVRAQTDQWPCQDVGENRIVGREPADQGMVRACGHDCFQLALHMIGDRVFARGQDAVLVDIGRERGTGAGFEGRDRQHACAGAKIQDASGRPLAQQPVERQQTAKRGAMVSGAEGRTGLHQKTDPASSACFCGMAAGHHEATGRNGGQALQ